MDQNNIDQLKINNVENYLKQGEYHRALENLKDLENKHNHFIIHWYLGQTYFKLHNYLEAIRHTKMCIELKSKDALNLNFLGQIYLEINNYEQAKNLFKEVLEIEEDNITASYNLAKINFDQGKIKEGEKIYKDLIKRDPLNFGAYYQLIKLNEKYLSNEIITKIKNNYSKLSLNNKIYSKLILAKENEELQKYSLEIKDLIDAHTIYYNSKQKAANQQFNFYNNLLPSFINKIKNLDSKINSDLQPIFIMGLPRSGTTLVEKIINSGKNRVQSLGESDVFDKVFFSHKIIKEYENKFEITDFKFLQDKITKQYFSQGLKKEFPVFTDKSISNFLYIDLILKIFPKAKFIYCYRNPLANVIGILKAFLPNLLWTHSLKKVFAITDLYYQKLREVKNYKILNIYIISLEELSEKPNVISKNLFKFLNFKWSKDCIENHNDQMILKTTSNLQVRKKITKHNLDYTSNYLSTIKELGQNYDWLV